ncbi:hypothetical protein Nepgr_006775 [Nepenthes gracilis]|uniref:Uncharacterized protein n=1 Tax=Nepenthes gracilis TaxID=150966 RepID=A0AAD3XHR7_NEPGR|nr:hypothetical protein Nepgr_006775 [Nepenthes gracilis]
MRCQPPLYAEGGCWSCCGLSIAVKEAGTLVHCSSWALAGGCCCWLHLYDNGSAAIIDLLDGVLWIEVAGAELLFNSWVLAMSGGDLVSWVSSSDAVWMTAYGLWLG